MKHRVTQNGWEFEGDCRRQRAQCCVALAGCSVVKCGQIRQNQVAGLYNDGDFTQQGKTSVNDAYRLLCFDF